MYTYFSKRVLTVLHSVVATLSKVVIRRICASCTAYLVLVRYPLIDLKRINSWVSFMPITQAVIQARVHGVEARHAYHYSKASEALKSSVSIRPSCWEMWLNIELLCAEHVIFETFPCQFTAIGKIKTPLPYL